MSEIANILFLHAQKDIDDVELLKGDLSILSREHYFELYDCKDAYNDPNDYSILSNKINNAHIVVFIISKQCLSDFSMPYLMKIKDDLYKDTRLTLIPVLIDNAKIHELSEFKGRNILRKKNIPNEEYEDIADVILETRKKLKPQYAFANPLCKALLGINYTEQRSIFDTYIVKNEVNSLNVILAQGTKQCGHQLLMKGFFQSHGIKVEDEAKQVLKFNAGNFGNFDDDDLIWYTIAQKVYDNQNPHTIKAKKIAKYLYERLQRENIVLIINDIDSSRTDVLRAIQKILSEMYKHINDAVKEFNQPLSHRVFLFLNDRSGNNYKKEHFETHFKTTVDSDIYENVFCVLPKIKPLSGDDVEQWLKWVVHRDIAFSVLRPYLKATCLIPKEYTEVYMKTAIENVFNALMDVDDSLELHKHKHLADWFPLY